MLYKQTGPNAPHRSLNPIRTQGDVKPTAFNPKRTTAVRHLNHGGATQKHDNPNLPSLTIGNENYLYLVFGRFPAELGPETRSNGSGSKNGAECAHN